MRFRRQPATPLRSDVSIVDLPDRHRDAYFRAGVARDDRGRRAQGQVVRTAPRRGLGVKLAVDSDDRAVGMIQYVPIELSPAEGDHLFMILCIWVHGYAKGVGDLQGVGVSGRNCSRPPNTTCAPEAPAVWPHGGSMHRSG